jgi:hypothetical protein
VVGGGLDDAVAHHRSRELLRRAHLRARLSRPLAD